MAYEERIYYDRFNSTNWTIVSNGTGEGVKWIANSYETEVLLYGGAIILKNIPTTGYRTLRVVIDVWTHYLEGYSWECCSIYYQTSGLPAAWRGHNAICDQSYVTRYGFSFTIADQALYNDQPNFQIQLRNSGDQGSETCFFRNLEIYGVPYGISTTKPITTLSGADTSSSTHLSPTKSESGILDTTANALIDGGKATQVIIIQTESNGDSTTAVWMIFVLLVMIMIGGIVIWKCMKRDIKMYSNPNDTQVVDNDNPQHIQKDNVDTINLEEEQQEPVDRA